MEGSKPPVESGPEALTSGQPPHAAAWSHCGPK